MQLEVHFTHRHALIFAFHGPQTRLPVPLFFAARRKRVRFTGSQKKKKKERKTGKKTGNKTSFFAFLFSQNI